MTKKISERNRQKFTGRAKSFSFLRLPHFLTDSPEFASLTPKAVKLLVEIARRYKGKNNGDLSIPWDAVKLRGWRSRTTMIAARDELVDKGFILTTRHGGNHVCNLYAITWEAIDDCPGRGLEVTPTTTAPNHWRRKNFDVQKLDTTCPESGRFAA